MKKTNDLEGKVPMLITTAKRGVFAGFVDPKDLNKTTLEVYETRMAVYWTEDVAGVIGLAADGPSKTCRITKPARKVLLHEVTAAFELTDKALAAWRKEPWA